MSDSQEPEDIWRKIEITLGIKIPDYLINLLKIAGYDNELSLSYIADDDIENLEEYARNELINIVNLEDEHERRKYYGNYFNNYKNFKIVMGHRKLLVNVWKEYKNKLDTYTNKSSSQTSSKNLKMSKKRPNTNKEDFEKTSTSADLNEEKGKLERACKNWLEQNKEKFVDVWENIKEQNINVNVLINSANSNSIFIAHVTCLICNIDIKVTSNIHKSKSYWTLSNYIKHYRRHFCGKYSERCEKKKNSNPTLDKFFNKQDLTPSSSRTQPPRETFLSDPQLNDITNLDNESGISEEVCDIISVASTSRLGSNSTQFSNFESAGVEIPGQVVCPASNVRESQTSKWKDKKYSRKEKLRRKREADSSNSLITDYFEVIEGVAQILEHEDRQLIEELSKIRQDTNFKLEIGYPKLLKLLMESAENNAKRKKGGKRYESAITMFGVYLFLIGGRLLYETICANLKDALPSIATVKRHIYENFNMVEGHFRFKELKDFLLKRNYPLKIWISEDATAVIGKVEYDSFTNNIVGFPLPLDKETGLPQQNFFPAINAKKISEMFENNKICKYAYIIVAQPMKENAPSFVLSVFGTDNTFTSDDILKRWKWMLKCAAENDIDILGFSSDGDSRLLKAMRIVTNIPTSIAFNDNTSDNSLVTNDNQHKLNWFQINMETDKPIVVQDTVHIGTKLRTRLLKIKLQIIIGKYIASPAHLEELVERVSKDKHLLTNSHLKLDDKMNFEAVEKMCSAMVREQLEQHVPNSNGTIFYLKLLQMTLDAFLSKTLNVSERIKNIWYVVFALRIWRYWLKENQYSLTKNFISLNSYICIELNAHALILMCLKYYNEPSLFLPWLKSSQPCEKTFRAIRSQTSTFSTVVNFSMLEILHRLHRLQTINEILCDLDDTYIFPREKARRLGEGNITNNETIKILPTLNEIIKIIEATKNNVLEDVISLGFEISCNDWMTIIIPNTNERCQAVNIERQLKHNSIYTDNSTEDDDIHDDISSSEQGVDDLEELTHDDLAVIDKFKNIDLDLVDFTSSTHEPISCTSPYLQIKCKSKQITVKKTTLCWLLSEKRARLSSDRLRRVMGPITNKETTHNKPIIDKFKNDTKQRIKRIKLNHVLSTSEESEECSDEIEFDEHSSDYHESEEETQGKKLLFMTEFHWSAKTIMLSFTIMDGTYDESLK
ncbi:hypothetical protein RN001_004786 [Aquatica leii]|uniref:Uncharacterized protein n=1 Tax=Aquatica leii TaxID=1421715 RepID=A0AAN7Q0C3_9COLE|nr:hypothetical protein RN001_004786 [Aquatica leii]